MKTMKVIKQKVQKKCVLQRQLKFEDHKKSVCFYHVTMHFSVNPHSIVA